MKLRENDWLTINNMILKLYSEKCDDLFDNSFMERLKIIVPYEKASFFKHDYEGDSRLCNPSGIGFGEGVLEEKTEVVNNEVPHAWVNFYDRSIVVRDSDLFDESEMADFSYYTQLLLDEGIKYALTISLVHNQMRIGVLTLFRTRNQPDFTDRETYIMQQLMEHIACYSYDIYDIQRYSKVKSAGTLDDIATSYDLTLREADVLKYVVKGYATKCICEELHISEPTVKKHLSSIYSKMNIKSKSELFTIIATDVI